LWHCQAHSHHARAQNHSGHKQIHSSSGGKKYIFKKSRYSVTQHAYKHCY